MSHLSPLGLILVGCAVLFAVAVGLLLFAEDLSEWSARRRGADQRISTNPANNGRDATAEFPAVRDYAPFDGPDLRRHLRSGGAR